ncbi:MAG: PEP-CTERM sorting domain-containing protein [Planctomycetia bacterium]|nr:PEP-CTERM sorting domain-containing protein [Planctomycetia bacterium]
MARRVVCVVTLLLTIAFSVHSPGAAWATFHLWKIDQIYSNASGNVQFVELADTADGEIFVGGRTLTSNGHTFTFPSNLPDGTPTAGQHMLLGTPGYFALAGVTQPDFTLPNNNFFSTSADTLTFAGGLDSVSFNGSQLPIDNLHSLNRSFPGAPLLSGINSPRDLAGQGGEIPPWENQDNPLDVDGNGKVAAKDVLNIINELLENGSHPLAAPTSDRSPPPFVDVDGNNTVAPKDVNTVITFLLDNPVPAAMAMGDLSQLAMPPPMISSQVISAPSTTSMAMLSPIISSVPEPTSEALALAGAGLLGVICMSNHRRSRAFGQVEPLTQARPRQHYRSREISKYFSFVYHKI